MIRRRVVALLVVTFVATSGVSIADVTGSAAASHRHWVCHFVRRRSHGRRVWWRVCRPVRRPAHHPSQTHTATTTTTGAVSTTVAPGPASFSTTAITTVTTTGTPATASTSTNATSTATTASSATESTTTESTTSTTETTTTTTSTGLPSRLGVDEGEYYTTPSYNTVAAGPVEFDVINLGEDDHNFTVSAQDGTVVGQIPVLHPGDEPTFTLNLPPGTYKLWCNIPGHDQLGMHATLTVQ